MTEDKDNTNRTARAFRKGVELARLDRQIKREAQGERAPVFSGHTFDEDPEEVTDAAILRRIRNRQHLQEHKLGDASRPQFNVERGDMDDGDFRAQLLQYSGIDDTNVDEILSLYEDRRRAKLELLERGCSNSMAEAYLDRQDYPRPPGWRSVFFYPDSNRPRNTIVIWGVLVAGAGWLLFGSI